MSENLRWWIGGSLAVLAFAAKAYVDESDKRDFREIAVHAVRDSIRVVLEADSVVNAERDSVALNRSFRAGVGDRNPQPSAERFRFLYESTRADSVKLAGMRAAQPYVPLHDVLRAIEASLGVEMAHWGGCVANRCAPDDGEMQLLAERTAVDGFAARTRAELRTLRDHEAEREQELETAQRNSLIGLWVAILAGLSAAAGAIVWIVATVRVGNVVAARAFAFGGGIQTRSRLFRLWLRRRTEDILRGFGRWLLWLDRGHVLFLLVIALPVLALLRGNWWLLLAWAALYGVQLAINIYRLGAEQVSLERRIAVIQGSFGGNIGSFVQQLGASQGSLSHDAAKMLCIGLLNRARHFAELYLGTAHGAKIRATLALPLVDVERSVVDLRAPVNKVAAIRVWCYDEPHDNRRWTTVPMGLPGGPTAFAQCTIEAIDDLSVVAPEFGRTTSFRSVLSIPIRSGSNGKPIAVLNLDSTRPNHFTTRAVERITPLVMPVVNIIALVLLTTQPGARYEFN